MRSYYTYPDEAAALALIFNDVIALPVALILIQVRIIALDTNIPIQPARSNPLPFVMTLWVKGGKGI